jgi:predicted unusual protein kinase regulating ubiquinone biosynthesis (AarF/ABC1/UbiB family)
MRTSDVGLSVTRNYRHCHADLHPGNILVALDSPPVPLLSSAAYIVDRFKPFGWKVPSSWREPAIVLLDVGAALRVSFCYGYLLLSHDVQRVIDPRL